MHNYHNLSEQSSSLFAVQSDSLLQIRMAVIVSGLEEHENHTVLLNQMHNTVDSVQVGGLQVDLNELLKFAIRDKLERE